MHSLNLWVFSGVQLIDSVVDFDSEHENMYIVPGVCRDLDKMKAIYRRLPDVLTNVRIYNGQCSQSIVPIP